MQAKGRGRSWPQKTTNEGREKAIIMADIPRERGKKQLKWY